jgi:hypothetical protein
MPHIQRAIARGEPLTSQGYAVTPVTQIARVTWPGGRLEWRRPLAIEVRDAQGVRRLPIHDATRSAMLGLFAAGFTLFLGSGLIARAALREKR